MSRPIDQDALAAEAHRLVVAHLEGHGNILSELHRGALLRLVDTFAAYCAGTLQGRRAISLPTGMGKTSAILAFLVALHRQGHQVPVAVAASRVEALCGLKRDLIVMGVPEALIGLKHGERTASERSTGTESRLFQLVTHARVRSGKDFALFGQHLGKPRPLCIYDETLLRADTFAFEEPELRKAVGVLRIELEARKDPLAPGHRTAVVLLNGDDCGHRDLSPGPGPRPEEREGQRPAGVDARAGRCDYLHLHEGA